MRKTKERPTAVKEEPKNLPDNSPDHYLKSVQDSVYFIGELEHTRRHALRSFYSVGHQLLDNPEDESLRERLVHYGVVAKTSQEVRRKFMEKRFSNVKDEDWCLLKSTAALQQLANELFPMVSGVHDEVNKLVDMTWSEATGLDMSGCKSCKEDRDSANS